MNWWLWGWLLGGPTIGLLLSRRLFAIPNIENVSPAETFG